MASAKRAYEESVENYDAVTRAVPRDQLGNAARGLLEKRLYKSRPCIYRRESVKFARMFAVLELGGKQYLVREKDVLRVEKLGIDAGKTVECDKVLLLALDKETKVGTPYLANAKIALKVRNSGLGDKVRIFKMKAKKRYKKLRGHRQPFTEVEITKITG